MVRDLLFTAKEFLSLSLEERQKILGALDDKQIATIMSKWEFWARPEQLPPKEDFRIWLLLWGRGAGKTRTAAEWVRMKVESGQAKRIALVGRTAADTRDVMVEGEALALDTLIPTPYGFTSMGKIEVGDKVFDENGDKCTVTWKSPVTINRKCFRISFSDGTKVVADEEHKWVTNDGTLFTRQLKTGQKIELCKPIKLHKKWLPIDPYVLGLWLGDGDSDRGRLRVEEEGQEEITKRGYILESPRHDNKLSPRFKVKDLTEALKTEDLLNNKHIPKVYLRASVEDRLDLLCGLMDSDGHTESTGRCTFTNKNKQLIEDTKELCSSLGIKSRINKKLTGTCDLRFYTNFPVHKLSRKRARLRNTVINTFRRIVDLKIVKSVPVACIAVDSPSNQYLITKSFIPTHNSGLIAISPPWDKPKYEPSKRRVTWKNGTMAHMYSADEPNALRGPQHDCAWSDELAAWRYMEAWDQLMFGLRLGNDPQCIVSTTPRPIPLIKELMKRKDTIVSRASTYDNMSNLAQGFIDEMNSKYKDTRLGRQELYAEILDDTPGALWTRLMLDKCRRQVIPSLERIIVAVDPAVSGKETSDEHGIIVVGKKDKFYYVLEDATISGSPDAWGNQAIACYRRHGADRIIAEINQGGDLVEKVLKTIDPDVPFTAVRATRGKVIRAEPIAALYEQEKVKHKGMMAALEDQMCLFTTDGKFMTSPDRVDALVWGLSFLSAKPKIDSSISLDLSTGTRSHDWE